MVSLLSLAIVAAGAVTSPEPSVTALGPPSVRLAWEPPEPAYGSGFSAGGEYATASYGAFFGGLLISMADGSVRTTVVGARIPTRNGAFVFGSTTSTTIFRYDVARGTTISKDVPFAQQSDDWEIFEINSADDSGRFVLFRTASGVLGQTAVFLFDFENGTLVRSPDEAVSGNVVNAVPLSISADGNRVVYDEFERVVLWDRVAGTRTAVELPEGIDRSFAWSASPDLEWVVFQASRAGIVPGLDAGQRLYRRNVSTGATSVVRDDVTRVRSERIYNGGRVVMYESGPPGPSAGEMHLSVSDADGPPRQIDALPVGSSGAGGVDYIFAVNDDATTISFTSFGDLVDGGDSDTRRWYVATVPLSPDIPDTPPLPIGPATASAVAVRCDSSPAC